MAQQQIEAKLDSGSHGSLGTARCEMRVAPPTPEPKEDPNAV
jgi:hypothetical protein